MGTRMEVAQLESRMNTEDYKKLQTLFLDSSGASCSLSRTDFVDRAWASVGNGSKEEYGLLFDNVFVTQGGHGLLLENSQDEGRIDWAELCSFLYLELSHKLKNCGVTTAPRWKPLHTLTCPHRDPVQKVLHLQSSGLYLTVSKGGTVLLLDGEDMSILHTHQLQNNTVAPKDLWVTDVVLLHNLHKIAVSFTCKEVCFYDILSKQDLSYKYKIQVSALYFMSAQTSLFESLTMGSESADVILWDDLLKSKHCSCYAETYAAHGSAWVRKVLYLSSLEAFVSCSTRPRRSMVIGWREKESRGLRVSCYFTKSGVLDVDYHCGLRLIATAGVDHQVLLWNPDVISKPVLALSGHSSPVTAVHFMQTKQQLLSYSKDKVLCLWDVSSQLCVHRLAGVFPKVSEDKHSLMVLQEEQGRLLLSSNSHLVLLEVTKEERRTNSHKHPVTCVLYNSLFRQVVSSDSSSSVICWQADTGQKVKQFERCHGNAEISTMALDVSQTRLFTAGSDGEVKVWDFDGHCLHRMIVGVDQAMEISQVLLLRTSILVVGWKRMVTVFHLHSFSQCVVEPSEWKGGIHHHGDTVCAAFQPPHTLVTGSYDGEIIVWNSQTEKALKKLHPDCEDYKKQQENGAAITRLLFIPGRTAVTPATGGADLVSCGGSGVVRFWSIQHSRLVGQFTAHNKDLGSIVMTLSPCGTYLITADREGTIKTWDIQYHCLKPDEGVNEELPRLLRSFCPHLDHVTHLEICTRGEKLILLSSSSDCRVALSYLSGELVGLFGQDHWSLETLHPRQDPGWGEIKRREEEDTRLEGVRSPPALKINADPGNDAASEEGEVGI